MAGAVLACVALSAAAQQEEPKGYIGGGYGISKYKDFCGPTPPGFECDEDDRAWRLQAGYMFFPWLGLEGSYVDFGEAKAPSVIINPPVGTTAIPTASVGKTRAYALSVLLRAPLGPVGLHAKLGYASVTARFTSNAQVQNNMTGAIQFLGSEARESNGEFIYGLGATYDITRQWHARFDWDRTEAKDNINP